MVENVSPSCFRPCSIESTKLEAPLIRVAEPSAGRHLHLGYGNSSISAPRASLWLEMPHRTSLEPRATPPNASQTAPAKQERRGASLCRASLSTAPGAPGATARKAAMAIEMPIESEQIHVPLSPIYLLLSCHEAPKSFQRPSTSDVCPRTYIYRLYMLSCPVLTHTPYDPHRFVDPQGSST